MIFEPFTVRYLVHKMSGLVLAKDGSWSVTKTSAATFHLLLALAVVANTWVKGFDMAVWSFYAACAIGHAAYDKTRAQIKDTEEKRLEAGK